MSKKNRLQSESSSTSSAAPIKQIQITSVLLWKYLTQDDLNKLEPLNSFDAEKYLANLLNLINYEIELREACFLDFFLTQYWWAAKQKKFNHEQISAYFSIVYILIENLKDKKLSLTENLNEFYQMLTESCEKTRLFNDQFLKDIINNLSICFFQNYKMFNYVANEEQEEITIEKDILIECPNPVDLPYPPPLDEAIPENIYNKYILKINDEIKNVTFAVMKVDQKQSNKIIEESSENIELNQQVVEQIHRRFDGVSIEEAKKIIYDVTNELVTDLKAELRNKIKDKEAALINELSKTQKVKSK